MANANIPHTAWTHPEDVTAVPHVSSHMHSFTGTNDAGMLLHMLKGTAVSMTTVKAIFRGVLKFCLPGSAGFVQVVVCSQSEQVKSHRLWTAAGWLLVCCTASQRATSQHILIHSAHRSFVSIDRDGKQ